MPGSSSTPSPPRASATRSPRAGSSAVPSPGRRPRGLLRLARRPRRRLLRVVLPGGSLPTPEAAALYSGLAADPVAGRSSSTPSPAAHRPSEVLTRERRTRWRAAWSYEQGIAELSSLLEGMDRGDDGRCRPGVSGVERGRPSSPTWPASPRMPPAAPTSTARSTPGASRDWPSGARSGPHPTWRRHADRTRDGLLRRLRRTAVGWSPRSGRVTPPSSSGPAWLVLAPGRRPVRAPRGPAGGAGRP